MMCQFSCSGDGDEVPNQLGLRSVHKAQRAEHTVSHRGSTPSTNALLLCAIRTRPNTAQTHSGMALLVARMQEQPGLATRIKAY